jgi:hypothetical protein
MPMEFPGQMPWQPKRRNWPEKFQQDMIELQAVGEAPSTPPVRPEEVSPVSTSRPHDYVTSPERRGPPNATWNMRLLHQQQISETEARRQALGPVANSQEAIPLVGQGAYDAYKDKARDVAALFTEATGIPVREPSLDPRMS